MIITDRFVWLHLPKTGGTTMTRIFRDLALPGVAIDDDGIDAKHDSIALREQQEPWRYRGQRRFVTSRRLTDWLVSDWLHKHRHMNLSLPFEPVRSGLYYSMRLGGVWVAADWWLRYFEIDNTVTALRLERLSDDFNRELLPLLPAGTPPLGLLPRENARPEHPEPGQPTVPNLSAADREQIRCCNPLWSAWEARVYGELDG